MNRWIAGMGALIVLWAGMAWALTPPELTGRVVDLRVCSNRNRRPESSNCWRVMKRRRRSSLRVLILPGLEGDALEDFSIRTVEKWHLGTRRRTMVC